MVAVAEELTPVQEDWKLEDEIRNNGGVHFLDCDPSKKQSQDEVYGAFERYREKYGRALELTRPGEKYMVQYYMMVPGEKPVAVSVGDSVQFDSYVPTSGRKVEEQGVVVGFAYRDAPNGPYAFSSEVDSGQVPLGEPYALVAVQGVLQGARLGELERLTEQVGRN